MTIHLVDTGPIVALLDRRDRYHPWARDVLATIAPPLVTCEPVLTEACFLLKRVAGGAESVLGLIARQALVVELRVAPEAQALRILMNRFADTPMSLADACLVRMSELYSEVVVVTLDGDFGIYRRHRRQLIPTIMPI